jgi:sigma-B regulation protein RsbU (phosphoserine phosphatase)
MDAMTIEATTDSATTQPRVLIADDQPDVLEALRLLLKGHGYTTETVTSPSGLLEAMARRDFDVILMDLNYARDTTSGQEGLDLLAHLTGIETAPPIVVMTGWASVGLAVEAMQHGVGDFVEKPWVNTRLLEILKKQIELGRQRRESRQQAIQQSQAQKKIASQFQHQEQEIEEARAIQQGFLPKDIPQIPGFEIAGAWQPAHHVGGDYFDVLAFPDETLGICIADVAGKGLPAALLMSNLQAAVRGLASPLLSPSGLCERLNSLILRNIAGDRFITFFYAQLDGPTRRLRYANAGHNAPIVLHRDGTHDRLREGGGVLGIFPVQTYALGFIELAPGDRLILFTDGVTEACCSDDEEFGEARLLKLLEENRSMPAGALQKLILEAAGEFSHGDWRDDATVIVLAST